MEFKNFLKEFETLKDERANICEKIKSHNLPVIIFGEVEFAESVTNELKHFGVEVNGYVVDDEYYKPGKTYLDLPVYNFSELEQQPQKYVFVLGMVGHLNTCTRVLNFLRDEKIIHYAFSPNTHRHEKISLKQQR